MGAPKWPTTKAQAEVPAGVYVDYAATVLPMKELPNNVWKRAAVVLSTVAQQQAA